MKVGVFTALLSQMSLDDVLKKLKSHGVTSPISIAIDGWTNTRHNKVTNLLCLCGGQAYYWCSIVNLYDRNSNATSARAKKSSVVMSMLLPPPHDWPRLMWCRISCEGRC